MVVVLRPEGVVVLGVTLAVLAAGRRLDGRRVGASGPLLLAAGAGAAALVFAGIWQWRWTGVFLPASAYSRLMMARREGIHLGPLWIYPRFPMRLAAYGPLAAGTAAAPWLLRDEAGQARFARVALVVLVATFVMYTFVTGAAGSRATWCRQLVFFFRAHVFGLSSYLCLAMTSIVTLSPARFSPATCQQQS